MNMSRLTKTPILDKLIDAITKRICQRKQHYYMSEAQIDDLYALFKARLQVDEIEAQARNAIRDEKIRESCLEAAYGPHGQG